MSKYALVFVCGAYKTYNFVQGRYIVLQMKAYIVMIKIAHLNCDNRGLRSKQLHAETVGMAVSLGTCRPPPDSLPQLEEVDQLGEPLESLSFVHAFLLCCISGCQANLLHQEFLP